MAAGLVFLLVAAILYLLGKLLSAGSLHNAFGASVKMAFSKFLLGFAKRPTSCRKPPANAPFQDEFLAMSRSKKIAASRLGQPKTAVPSGVTERME